MKGQSGENVGDRSGFILPLVAAIGIKTIQPIDWIKKCVNFLF